METMIIKTKNAGVAGSGHKASIPDASSGERGSSPDPQLAVDEPPPHVIPTTRSQSFENGSIRIEILYGAIILDLQIRWCLD